MDASEYRGTGRRILLHVCCAPCSTACIERLEGCGCEPVLFFSNSNIYPGLEYERRLLEARRLAETMGLGLIEDVYDHEAWLAGVRGLENEPEGGRRCLKCFGHNLRRAAEAMAGNGIEAFTTTLTVSRHKASKDIFAVGAAMPGFMAMDFKKKGGSARSMELSRALGLYRQGYCGCEFSMPASFMGKNTWTWPP
jgi:predicted adenine nucleotide alpha hydrolase (AANH) superfamily ATPase